MDSAPLVAPERIGNRARLMLILFGMLSVSICLLSIAIVAVEYRVVEMPSLQVKVLPQSVQDAPPVESPARPPVLAPQALDDGYPTFTDKGLETQYFSELIGVPLIRIGTEAGAWQFNVKPSESATAKCLKNFACTWHVDNDDIVFHAGIDQSASLRAGTFRRLLYYPEGLCGVWQGELAFANQEHYTIRFQSVEGVAETCGVASIAAPEQTSLDEANSAVVEAPACVQPDLPEINKLPTTQYTYTRLSESDGPCAWKFESKQAVTFVVPDGWVVDWDRTEVHNAVGAGNELKNITIATFRTTP